MRFDESSVFFQELMAEVSSNPSGVVPFVGAGLSRYGPLSNQLPGWYNLIQGLKTHCLDLGLLSEEDLKRADNLIEKSDFISTTDLLVDRLGEPLFRKFIRRELDIFGKETSPAIVDLIMISWSLIVTTNLDNFIESAYTNRTRELPNVVTARQLPELADVISGASKTKAVSIAKIHGTLSDGASWALTSSHYKKLLTSPQYLAALKTLFMKRIFFVGFGLVDDDFDLVQDYLSKLFPEGVGDFYALVPSSARGGANLNKLIRERGLKPIFYEIGPQDANDPWAGHSGVGECLSALARVWSDSRADLPVTLKYFSELESSFIGKEKFLKSISQEILLRRNTVQIVGFGGEGKTTVVLHWLQVHRFEIREAGFAEVFGFSFYHASVEHFINDAFNVLCRHAPETSVARRLERLVETVRTRPILFILDGLEVIQDPEGDLINRDFRKFFAVFECASSKAICTTRLPVNFRYTQLLLDPLNPEEAEALFLEGKNSTGLDRRLVKQAGGHALSIRVLKSISDQDALDSDIPIEELESLDPLYGNKLSRVLDFYGSNLSEPERAVLKGISIFRGPTTYDILEHVLTEPYNDTEINLPLVSKDLRQLVYGLLSKRLLVNVSGSLLSSHPNVKNYFGKLADPEALRPLHRRAAFKYMQDLTHENPSNLAECKPYLDAAYHACVGHLWAEFHHLFHDRLNRGNQNYLANVISSWTDFEHLANLCLTEAKVGDPIDLAYYAACNARALKHLGKNDLVDGAYQRCVRICAKEHVPETARYLNNWMTHRIYTGQLSDAVRMVRWNYGLLNWPQEDHHRRWQQEHADLSFAWLSGLLGNLYQAQQLFKRSSSAWDVYDQGRLQFFDALSNVEPEFMVSMDATLIPKARDVFQSSLELAKDKNWREATIRSLLSGSYVERAERRHTVGDWDSAINYVTATIDLEAEIGLPTSKLLVILETLRLTFDMDDVGESSPWIAEHTNLLDLASRLMERTGWELYRPELFALAGRANLVTKDRGGALEKLKACVSASRLTGNRFVLMTRYQSFQALKTGLSEQFELGQDGSPLEQILSDFRPSLTSSMLLDGCESGFERPVLLDWAKD